MLVYQRVGQVGSCQCETSSGFPSIRLLILQTRSFLPFLSFRRICQYLPIAVMGNVTISFFRVCQHASWAIDALQEELSSTNSSDIPIRDVTSGGVRICQGPQPWERTQVLLVLAWAITVHLWSRTLNNHQPGGKLATAGSSRIHMYVFFPIYIVVSGV